MNTSLKKKAKIIEQKRFQVLNDSMQMNSVKKTQFAGLYDKCYYLHDGIVSFPFGHYLSKNVREEKEKYRSELYLKIQKEMYKFLALESRGVNLCERLRVLRSIMLNLQRCIS